MDESKEAVCEGADRHTRGRVCSPGQEIRRLRRGFGGARGQARFLAGFWRVSVALLFLGTIGAWAAPSLRTSLDRNSINMGESVTLSLAFKDCDPKGQPDLPPMPGLEQTGSTGTSRGVEVIGTHVSSTVTYSIGLHPTHPGRFTIPALQLTLNGAQLVSRPLTLNVANAPVATDGAFAKLIVPAKPVYLGQVVPVEIQCYCQDAQQVQLPQLSGDGFNVSTVPSPQQPTPRVNVNNTIYNYLDFHIAATPVKTGALTLGPVTWSLVLLTTRQDSFFPFGFRETHPVTVNSEPATIHVLPIPTNAPAGFGGAIGNFSLAQYDAGPTNVAVGDPITVKIRIAGKGAFDSVSLSSDPLGWREFKTYPPSGKFESTDPAQIEGSKYFEQVITPLNAEIKEIPAFSFVYFDPDAGKFRALSHPALPLAVHPATGVAQPTVISMTAPTADDSPPPAQEIVHIKEHLGMLESVAPPLIERPSFLVLLGLAPLAWICAMTWRRQREKLANNPRLRRQREVARRINEGLKELSAQAAANNAQAFYATVFRLLQEQLGERLDLPASAITEAAAQEVHGRGLRAEAENLLRELFHVCNQYRYAHDHGAQELASIIPKVQTVLRELRNMRAAKTSPAAAVAQSIGCALVLLAAAGLRAETASDAFDQANKLYERGKYSQAAAAYQKMIESGRVSAAVYFNLGNAWFKAGQTGRAIFAYRRAEMLSPRDPDIRANLQFARNQAAGGASAPGWRWRRWLDRLTLNEWTLAAAVAFGLLFIVLTARQIWPRLRKSGSGLPIALAAVCAGLVGCAAWAAEARLAEQLCVVVVPEAVVRLGPLDEAQSAFTVRDGAELTVLDQKGDWLEVGDAAKRIGWLPQNEVAR